MTQAFPVSGNIEPAEFPHLLVDLHGHGATGSLKVTGQSHPKALYFRGGRILFGSSNDPRDQLGSILIESGKITREQLDEVNAKVGPGNPLARVLADSGFVNQRELGDAARVKVERILADVLSWETGTFEFEDGVLPKGAVDLKLSTEKLLLAAVQRIPDRAFALRHVGLHSILAPVPEGQAALSEIRAEVWPLLERLDGERTLKDAIALTHLDEFEAAKTACALLFLGAVRKAEEEAAGDEELDLAREAQSGLGVEDEAEPLFTMPGQQPVIPAAPAPAETIEEPEEPAVSIDAESTSAQEEDRPFVFPEPVPPPPAEPGFGAEPEGPQPPALEAEPAPSFQPPSYPSPSFPPPTAPIPETLEPTPPEPPSAPTVVLAAPAEPAEPPASPPFDVPAPARSTPTSPGNRPLPLIPPPPRKDAPGPSASRSPADEAPEIAVAPSASRPNLKALDELLSPAGSGRRPAERSRAESWQPQFRSSASSRRVAVRAPERSRSGLPVVLSALAMILVGTVAAWYFLLRKPPTPRPVAPITVAPITVAQAPPPPRTTVPETPPAATPTPPAASPPSLAATATPPAPTPSPRVSAAPSAPASGGASARVLLGRGALPEASREFATALRAGSRTRFSVQLLTACAPETVQKAVGAAGSEKLFILPVVLQGRTCYRVCWGTYADRRGAEAALVTVPAYFRQGGARPRVSPLADLLP